MAKRQMDSSWNTHSVETSGDDFIELSELDFDDLPPTDPIGRPRETDTTLLPPAPNRVSDFAHLRTFLRAPPCVEFEDDRFQDLTPPPVVGQTSLSPLAASLPPPRQDVRFSQGRGSPWTIPLVAVSAILALGIVAMRVVDKQAMALAPSMPLATAVLTSAFPAPLYTPDDFPVFHDPAEEKIEYTWIDLRNAPREDRPASGRPPNEAETYKLEQPVPSDEGVAGEIVPVEDTIAPVEAVRAFDRQEALASLDAAAGSAVACGERTGFAKVSVTFAPTGRVTTALVDGPFAGTATGGCIAKTFRNARVQPFDGTLVTVRKTIVFR